MAPPFSMLLFFFLLYIRLASSALLSITRGSFLSVEKPSDVLVSPSGTFSAGFFRVGDNAYSFAIWHGEPVCSVDSCVPVWMANRDIPVNGEGSRLSLMEDGNLILTDAGKFPFSVWSSGTGSSKGAKLQLNDTGNLVLVGENGETLWQSFDFPTDTLLPTQVMKRDTRVISSRSRFNYSEGRYSLHFSDDEVLRLIFNGPTLPSSYWPPPWLPGRFTSKSSRSAVLDPLGHFLSTDTFEFFSSDYGIVVPRRLTLDHDGNLRLYSLDSVNKKWLVTWDAFTSMACFVFGVCGNNSICNNDRSLGRSCSCVPGYERVDPNDWSLGCRPTFPLSDGCSSDVAFVKLLYVDFYGNDYNTTVNTTLNICQSMCAGLCSCRGFQYSFDSGIYKCYLKTELFNGNSHPSFTGEFFIKVNKSVTTTKHLLERQTQYNCTRGQTVVLDRRYPGGGNSAVINFMLWFAIVVAGIEIIVVFVFWFFFFRNQRGISAASHTYFLASTGFQRYSYGELRKATRNFSQEIGRGAGGIVYRAVLPDNRLAAVKLLNEATTGEADFLAEVSIIGKLNHMNLIEMWGYCVEGKHRLLVYEHVEHGSLAENLSSPQLDWRRRFDIAVGTAKGLAYLHEECLEWVLHCDVKPQNILLDSEYRPKVADFGLSKLMDREKASNPEFSRIRGTRGYMAPEWVSNLPITSKVDVYSYGVVMLELVTGISPTASVHSLESGGDIKHVRLVSWVRQKMHGSESNSSRMGNVVDPSLRGNYDKKKMEALIQVALQCVELDKDVRPTMGEVVEMLLRSESNDL